MLCDIQAEFLSQSLDPHIVEGSLQLSQVEDRSISTIKVELIGSVSYLCPTFNNGNNFMDPERPSYILNKCQFISKSTSLKGSTEMQSLSFQLPHYIEMTDTMKKKLTLNRTGTESRYQLPPTFAEEPHSYLETMFTPWKQPSKTKVEYQIKATVSWNVKAGMGRLLGATRHKVFRKQVLVLPSRPSERGQTLLPRYSGMRSKHWHREPCSTASGMSGGGSCSVFTTSRIKVSLLGDPTLTLEEPHLFCLELNQSLRQSNDIDISFELVRIMATRLRMGRSEVERRGNTILSNFLQVIASPDQVDDDNASDCSSSIINLARYRTSDRLLTGSICLLDSTTKHGPLSPAFTFAGLTVEYRLRLHITCGTDQFSLFTPPILLECKAEKEPPIYTSVLAS